MKNRIRKSVEMIRQADASLKENLSELDFKLYSMSPSGFFGPLEQMTGFELNVDLDYAADEEAEGAENIFDQVVGNETNVGQHGQNDSGIFHSGRVLVVETPEELEEYMSTSIIDIVTDEEESNENIRPLISDGFDAQYDEDYINETATVEDCLEESCESVQRSTSFNTNYRVIGNVGGKANKSVKASQRKVAQKPVSKPVPQSLKTIKPVDATKVKNVK